MVSYKRSSIICLSLYINSFMHADEFTRPPTTLINVRGRVNSAGQVAITTAARGICNYWRQAKINLEMAKKLPSNPDFLLKLLDDLPE